jgi:hypothetical protein
MISARSHLRLHAVALAATFGAMLACHGTHAAAPSAEQIQVSGAQKSSPVPPDPSHARIDANGLLRNGIVANAGSYG